MFLKIEGDQLVNLSLISRVEMRHQSHQRTAILYNVNGAEVVQSRVAYQYFMQVPGTVLPEVQILDALKPEK